MKKGFVAIAAAVALAATSLIGPAVAGIGPARGLPLVSQAQLVTNGGDTYTIADTTGIEGVRGSVMCVACHTRNPAVRTAYNSGNGSTVYNGSHFVTANFADTSEGGGYSDGNKTRVSRTATPLYMATASASRANGGTWAGAPKYGTAAGAEVGLNTSDPTTPAAQMICESCHNIVTNIGAAKLLEAAFANGGDNAAYTVPGTATLQGINAAGGTLAAKLCVGCHGRMSAAVSAEWQLHPIGSQTWSGTHHHRNTGTAPYYGSGTEAAPDNMALTGRDFYANPLVQMWAANYGEIAETSRALTYNAVSNKKMKTPVATGQIAVAGGATSTQVLCTNCHRAHNAATSSGTTILMTYTPAVAFGPTPISPLSGMGQVSRATHITQTNPLCLNCHQ